MALSKTTQDHDEIRQWAEARGGKPAEVASTEHDGDTGILRFMFPNAPHHNDGSLKEIEWDEFFTKFDKSGLALVYQEQTADGERSDFNKLIHPENDSAAASKPAKKTTATRAGASKPAAKKSPAKKAPAKKAPAKKAPAKKTPAKKGTEKKAPVKLPAPAKKAVKKTAAKKTVARKGAKSTRSR